jgi:hypothetical protein
MPSYNCAPIVVESLRSISQGNLGPDDEIIVVNIAASQAPLGYSES